jgi:hypothetical protein
MFHLFRRIACDNLPTRLELPDKLRRACRVHGKPATPKPSTSTTVILLKSTKPERLMLQSGDPKCQLHNGPLRQPCTPAGHLVLPDAMPLPKRASPPPCGALSDQTRCHLFASSWSFFICCINITMGQKRLSARNHLLNLLGRRPEPQWMPRGGAFSSCPFRLFVDA